MSQLTQAQVLAYNKKVQAAKDKASQDKARKELAEKELARTCKELSDLLGKEITPENLEAEYEAFVAEATKTMESGNRILDGLEQEQKEAMADTSATTATATFEDETAGDPVVFTTPKVDNAKVSVTDDLDSLLGLK